MRLSANAYDQIVCAYFANCSAVATGVLEHSVLGIVPSCAGCAGKVEMPLIPATFVVNGDTITVTVTR